MTLAFVVDELSVSLIFLMTMAAVVSVPAVAMIPVAVPAIPIAIVVVPAPILMLVPPSPIHELNLDYWTVRRFDAPCVDHNCSSGWARGRNAEHRNPKNGAGCS